jgi:hypothetical protein
LSVDTAQIIDRARILSMMNFKPPAHWQTAACANRSAL